MNSALICATGPPKRKSVLSHTPFPKLHFTSQQSTTGGAIVQQMRREIQTLRAIQAPFGKIFWALEQRIARLSDEIERLSA
jgi:hypothetical protein